MVVNGGQTTINESRLLVFGLTYNGVLFFYTISFWLETCNDDQPTTTHLWWFVVAGGVTHWRQEAASGGFTVVKGSNPHILHKNSRNTKAVG